MTPNKVVSAYRAIKEISGIVFPYKTARAVTALKRALQNEIDTIVCAEKDLVTIHGGKPDGIHYKFEDTEKAEAFQAEYDDFMNQDANVVLPTVDLSDFAETLSLSPDAIEVLDGIVIFEKEETDNG